MQRQRAAGPFQTPGQRPLRLLPRRRRSLRRRRTSSWLGVMTRTRSPAELARIADAVNAVAKRTIDAGDYGDLDGLPLIIAQRRAEYAVQRELAAGRMVRPSVCVICGETEVRTDA